MTSQSRGPANRGRASGCSADTPMSDAGKHSMTGSSLQTSYVSRETVASMLDVNKRTVERWEAEGLTPHRLGRLVRYKLADVLAWAEAR